jgi:hypothetical protein
LAMAPILIVLIWVQFGALCGSAALFAFLSMFRHPLRYFWRLWVARRQRAL